MKLMVSCCLVCILLGCGSKKEFTRVESKEDIRVNERLYAELYRTTKLLELLDIKIRQVETRDTAGNVRIETEAEISKRTEADEQDTTKITVDRQEEGEKVVNQEAGKERSGVMGSWVWIVGFGAVIVVALVVGIYIVKK